MRSDLSLVFADHGSELRRYLHRRLGDPHMASDLVQDTFVRVIERQQERAAPARGPEFRVQDIRAYLYTVARNLMLNHLKQEARRRTDPVAPEAFGDIADDRPSPEDAVDSRLQLERIHAMVQELPRRTQEIFVLNRIDGLSHAEVASRLRLSESAVQKHLAMAIAHMTRRLRGR